MFKWKENSCCVEIRNNDRDGCTSLTSEIRLYSSSQSLGAEALISPKTDRGGPGRNAQWGSEESGICRNRYLKLSNKRTLLLYIIICCCRCNLVPIPQFHWRLLCSFGSSNLISRATKAQLVIVYCKQLKNLGLKWTFWKCRLGVQNPLILSRYSH